MFGFDRCDQEKEGLAGIRFWICGGLKSRVGVLVARSVEPAARTESYPIVVAAGLVAQERVQPRYM